MTELTTRPWDVKEEDFPRSGPPDEQARFLLRYAILAPSSHNSQPWRFEIRDRHVDVYADPSRWLRVADADQRELYLSVGCALENLIVAGEYFGLAPRIENLEDPGTPEGGADPVPVARVHLRSPKDDPSSSRRGRSGLFESLTRRHTNHQPYDGRPVPDVVRMSLEALAVEPAVQVHFTDDGEVRRRVDDLTVRADAIQFADPEWRKELGEWLGRGVFGANWLMSKMSQLAVTHLNLSRSVSKKDHELLQSASLLGVVALREVDRHSRVRAGQVFERVFLAATAAGLALQPMNQILQVPEVRKEFEGLLPADWGAPQITFRVGYADPEEHTPRRPVTEVLIDGGSPG